LKRHRRRLPADVAGTALRGSAGRFRR